VVKGREVDFVLALQGLPTCEVGRAASVMLPFALVEAELRSAVQEGVRPERVLPSHGEFVPRRAPPRAALAVTRTGRKQFDPSPPWARLRGVSRVQAARAAGSRKGR
jgi:hypothetical protein